jgi:hypothetical protein
MMLTWLPTGRNSRPVVRADNGRLPRRQAAADRPLNDQSPIRPTPRHDSGRSSPGLNDGTAMITPV